MENNKNIEAILKSQPNYYYSPKGLGWALYKKDPDGLGGTKVDESYDKEAIKKKCYELNGWNYIPKKGVTKHE